MSEEIKIESFKDYVEFTRTTAVYPKEKELEYLIFGLADELGELKDKVKYVKHTTEDIVDELSDVCWYVGRLVDNRELTDEIDSIKNFSIDRIVERADYFRSDQLEMVDDAYKFLSELTGNLKKFIRDGNESKLEKADQNIKEIVYFLMLSSTVLGGYNLKNVLEINVAKLSDRKDRGVLKGDGDKR